MMLENSERSMKKMRRLKLIGSLLLVLFAGYAYAADQMPAGVQARKADSGTVVLADSKAITLYISGRDTDGKSTCNGQCAANWPALAATVDAKPMGDWSVVTRDDGSKQRAYKGRPLYTFVRDVKAGDTAGEGMANNTWHVAVA
jgi:predicted lipoprotein with Yx(FWY)xxD motif